MNNKDVAQAFANGSRKAQGNNLYIEGDSIYSYGPHFPIATRRPEGVLLTTEKYSPTTSKHTTYVKTALADVGAVMIPARLIGGFSKTLEAVETPACADCFTTAVMRHPVKAKGPDKERESVHLCTKCCDVRKLGGWTLRPA
jgi:hypothetical protein